VIYDSAGIWNGFLTGIRLDAAVEQASARLAEHVASHWSGQELPGPWEPTGENSWIAGASPPPAAEDSDDRPQSPTYDWPSVFRSGDVVRLDDGRLAVVGCVMNYAAEPPAKWELVIRTLDSGHLDDTIWAPWHCRLAPGAQDEAHRQGLL
jgi:hypothetical protein